MLNRIITWFSSWSFSSSTSFILSSLAFSSSIVLFISSNALVDHVSFLAFTTHFIPRFRFSIGVVVSTSVTNMDE